MANQVYTRQEFAKKFSPFINQITNGTGIHTGTVLAQAIVESQGKVNGSYRVAGSGLSQRSNNLFGIKCHGWSGEKDVANTGEFTSSGSYYEKEACFRKYPSVEDSIRDHLSFLQKNKRYREHGVFSARTVREQAQALQRAGYATDPNYANMLESVYNGIKNHISTEIPAKTTGSPSLNRSSQKLTKKQQGITITFVAIGLVGLITAIILLRKSK